MPSSALHSIMRLLASNTMPSFGSLRSESIETVSETC